MIKSQSRMKEELKNIIDKEKCYDYQIIYLAGRKEILIKIATVKGVEY